MHTVAELRLYMGSVWLNRINQSHMLSMCVCRFRSSECVCVCDGRDVCYKSRARPKEHLFNSTLGLENE